ncbi:MAG TPA: efflux RND transporter periplasmic adaptor subunit [Bryobacteraceae bacterium]|nr:efflux RND transporter periplasmic adaptor subunit [Bryobacteraceae bacterium]
MKRRYIILLALAPLAALGFWAYTKKTEPLATPFARVRRETIVSNLITNGKVEPLRFALVRADLTGSVTELPVKEGQNVSQGAVLVHMKVPDLEAQLAAAQSRLEQAKATLDNIERGGRKAELVEIDASIARAKLDRDTAQRNYDALHRLEAKQSATRVEVDAAQATLRQSELAIDSLERKRAALITSSDKAVAEAKLYEAEADVRLAQRRMSDAVVRSPIAGTVYNLPVRMGTYLNAGDLVAGVGVLDKLRVRVYVDEPELGRVSVGLPVNITWEARPGRTWPGTVEQLPAEIHPMGTRQVGEVLCTIENPEHLLVPGTNVDTEIRARVVENALTIPKEAMRRDTNGAGVFVLAGDVVRWRPVKTGTSSISRVQVSDGLAEGDAVALPSEGNLRDGEHVRALYP